MVSQARTEQALRLLEQVEAQYQFEAGMIAPTDWERFSCCALLLVASGETTLDLIVGGWDTTVDDPNELERIEREKLAEWEANARRVRQ